MLLVSQKASWKPSHVSQSTYHIAVPMEPPELFKSRQQKPLTCGENHSTRELGAYKKTSFRVACYYSQTPKSYGNVSQVPCDVRIRHMSNTLPTSLSWVSHPSGGYRRRSPLRFLQIPDLVPIQNSSKPDTPYGETSYRITAGATSQCCQIVYPPLEALHKGSRILGEMNIAPVFGNDILLHL
jgi:hypothetical protein